LVLAALVLAAMESKRPEFTGPESRDVFPAGHLVEELRKAAGEMREYLGKDKADAQGAMRVRALAQRACGRGEAGVQAYFLELAIDDVFSNLFGDLPYTKATEAGRKSVCDALAGLFGELADHIERNDMAATLPAWERFTSTYFAVIDKANESFRASRE
jgi:hypothetical protein